jgi:hypothetical protein
MNGIKSIKIVSFDRTYAVEGFGEAKPPQMSPFSRCIGGFAADTAGKDKFLEGHPEGTRPSKPPMRAPTA